jgi:hypothetical protein
MVAIRKVWPDRHGPSTARFLFIARITPHGKHPGSRLFSNHDNNETSAKHF